MTTSIVSPLILTAGSGLYANVGLVINSEFTANIAAYDSLPLIANLLSTIDDAYNQPGLAISSATVANLTTIGANVAGNYLPALGDSVPSNVSVVIGNDNIADGPFGLTGRLQRAADQYLGQGNYSVFCQAFATADAYVTLTNQIIFSADRANSYLGPTFVNMDDLITGDLTRINLATQAWGQDLQALGRLFDFNDISQLGTPAGLLRQLSLQGNMINGTLPAVRTALRAQELTDQDISDLVNNNLVGLFNPTGLTQSQFDKLQRRAYRGLCNVTGVDLADVLSILGVVTPNISAMCDLLNPVKIFPNSYRSLTLPTPAGDVLLYDDDGSVNDIVADTLASTVLVPTGCEDLAKIIPPDQAQANRALQIAFGQVKNISAVTLPALARAVLDISTMRDLDLVANIATPISSQAQTFYDTNLAIGTGPLDSILLTDVLGTPTGAGVNQYLDPVRRDIQSLIDNADLATLDQIYSRMVDLCAGVFGTPPTIVIPAGPAAGSYLSYDTALSALVTAADVELGNIIAALGTQLDDINSDWTAMAQHLSREELLQSRAGIDFSTNAGLGQLEITSFLTNLTRYGVNTQEGMSAQYLQLVSDTATVAGQALIGSMREARNNVAMDAVGIGHDNSVPDSSPVPLPQADLGDATYTPDQARVLVQARLSPG